MLRLGHGYNMIFIPYNDAWKARRRLFHKQFTPTAAMRYRPKQLKTTHVMLDRLLETPGEFMEHLTQ